MSTDVSSLSGLSDVELLTEVKRLSASERRATAALIRSLMELDARRLYLAEGCASLFTYCTQVLHLSEHAAYGRIAAARAARRFPRVLELLEDGTITLTTITLLAPHLTDENHVAVLESARHRNKAAVEAIVAALRPVPDVRPLVRRLPERAAAPDAAPAASVAPPPSVAAPLLAGDDAEPVVPSEHGPLAGAPGAPQRRANVRPSSPARYTVQFTIEADTREKLRRAQDLLRHAVPTGDVAVVFDRALTLLLAHLEKQKFGATERPRQPSRPIRPRSRHIPAAVRRDVMKRDGARCAFVGAEGRCQETGRLEFHHVVPYADGGLATAENIQLRCRTHNAYEADRWFGPTLARERAPVWRGANSSHLFGVAVSRVPGLARGTRPWIYCEVWMVGITQVLRLWRAGVPKKRIAACLGLDAKTVRRTPPSPNVRECTVGNRVPPPARRPATCGVAAPVGPCGHAQCGG